MTERILLVDWGYHETRLLVYARQGWALTPIASKLIRSQDTMMIAHEAAKLCLAYNAIPQVDISGPGEMIFVHLQSILSASWKPQPTAEPRLL